MLHFGLKFPYLLLFFLFALSIKIICPVVKELLAITQLIDTERCGKERLGILALARLQAIMSFKSHKAGEKFWRSLPF